MHLSVILLGLTLSASLFGICPHWPPDEFQDRCANRSPKQAAEEFERIFVGKLNKAKLPDPRRTKKGKEVWITKEACVIDREMKVLATLHGSATDTLRVRAKDGCRFGCPPLLTGAHTWVVFAKKQGADWEIDPCAMTHAVTEPFPTLDDLEARFRWKQAQIANGVTSLSRPISGTAESRSHLSHFKPTELLPRLAGLLPALHRCGVLDHAEGRETELALKGAVGAAGRLETLEIANDERFGAVYGCVREQFETATYPQPLVEGRNTFSLFLSFQKPKERDITYLTDAQPPAGTRSALAIGAASPEERAAGEVLKRNPRVFNECRPQTKFAPSVAWPFAAAVSFDLEPGGRVRKDSVQVRPFAPSRPAPNRLWNESTAAQCITSEIEKIQFSSVNDRETKKISLIVRVFQTR